MTTDSRIHLVECPRDAMQGWTRIISTKEKVNYLNALLQVGFDTLDCGSFVSAKAIPQMADTSLVVPQLLRNGSATKLLVIVANVRGAHEAVAFDEIDCIGFPFSISETFQQRNTNSSMAESLQRVEEIQNLCIAKKKTLVVYLSMGFGNPYGDVYNVDILLHWAAEMVKREVAVLSLADTVGVATPQNITTALTTLISAYPTTSIGVHLHANAANWQEKFEAALQAGCTRIDGALKGIGGCPMADDRLVGNMNTEWIINYLRQNQYPLSLNTTALQQALLLADEVFS